MLNNNKVVAMILAGGKGTRLEALTKKTAKPAEAQLSLFGSPEDISVTAELKALDLNNMTPVKAMLYLQELKDRLS